MSRKHVCQYFTPPHRGRMSCTYCGKMKYKVAADEWRWSMPLRLFAEKWLPAISGTQPENMMTVRVAFPFEWNCYESWNPVFRVRFDFTDVLARVQAGLGTPADVMNGWMSEYQEDFCRIDYDAEQYFLSRTGRPYGIGDNTYAAMRAIIQS